MAAPTAADARPAPALAAIDAPPRDATKADELRADAAADDRVKASPYVRRLARERGLDLHAVAGTGPHGRIVQRDLASTTPTPARPIAPRAEPERRPLSPMRKAIARRLTESKQTVPHFYLTADLDVAALIALRAAMNDDDEAHAAPLSLNDLLVRACALALTRVPACNASFAGDAIVVHRRIDLSIAVALEDGLVTPVVRDADRKSVRAIAEEIRALAERARARKLAPEEMTGGTFSISNLGMFGVDAFAAVINPPEGAILAIGRARTLPVVTGEAIAIGRRLAVTLSCDHRVVDGAVGAQFLRALRALIERPMQLLS